MEEKDMQKKDIKELKYDEALLRLEQIADKMENGECGVDELTSDLKEAKALIKHLKSKLLQTEKEVNEILQED